MTTKTPTKTPRKKQAKPKQTAEATEVITAYKGFDKNLQCRGYQFEVGKTYQHDGEVKTCKSGFHACEYPLDVFNYYQPSAGNRFAVVKASGQISRHSNDTKIASEILTVEAEIRIHDLVARAVDWVLLKIDKSCEQTNTGNYSAATNTGDQSAATNTGNQSVATNTGYRSAATVSGKESIAISIGAEGRAKGAEGSAIVLVYRDDECRLIHIRASKVGENGIKPDTFYMLDKHGNFIEADE
ncbi:MAG: hypothetical protein LBE22_10520 [Azoarcus sp.]|jgi:hypothetical protein|nr:hypothetical protein [Azoarcus sp.]